jgi:radical SAM protein with 4Fe4S-binding SPASM domain
MTKLTLYPVLAKEFSISNVITEKGDNMLIYNTKTKVKARPNKATYEFVKQCRGDKSLKEIIAALARMSGESVEKIQETLLPLVKKMEENTMLFLAPSPVPVRPGPCEVNLSKRLQGVSLEITRKCNLQCIHCYSDSGKKREKELTTKELYDLIDEFAQLGVLNILVTGGEPLLHPDVFDIIAYIRSKPMSVMLFTNGTMVTEEVVTRVKELGVLSVTVSLDGATAKTHDTFRGGKSFDAVVEAVNLLKKAEIPVRVNVSLHKGILGEIVLLLDLFKKWGITEYFLGPITYTGRPTESGNVITPEEYKTVLEQVKEYEKTVGIPTKKRLPYFPELITCGIGMGNLTVRSNGVIAPCITFPDDISLGNVRTDSLADIWNDSPLLNKLRCMSALENDTCKTCAHIRVCGGGCIANNYRRTGELGSGDPYECAYFEVHTTYTPVEIDEQYLPVEIL